jgi:hypothetical protein
MILLKKGYTLLLLPVLFTYISTTAQNRTPLYIDSTGKVGIGTVTPVALLDVRGNAIFAGNMGIGTTTPAAMLDVNGTALFGGGSAGKILLSTDAANGTFTNTAGNLLFATKSPAGFIFSSGDTERLRINAGDGNVGIGTGKPLAPLDVNGMVRMGGFSATQPGYQGLYAGWNKSGGTGEANFVNHSGAGAGGFIFENLPPKTPGTMSEERGNPLTLMQISGSGDVTITGNVTAKTVNGEKPPYMFQLNPTKVKNASFGREDIPSAVIKNYLGDADGGTIRLIRYDLNNSNNTDVLNIYITLAENGDGNIYGYLRQSDGTTKNIILGPSSPKEDKINWRQIHIGTKPLPGVPVDNDPYKLLFLSDAGYSCTVIIYDR